MANKAQFLQDPFLNELRKEKVPVSIYLINGIKLQGTVDSFDQFVILLKSSVNQMVYKHAISTVVPSRNVEISASLENVWFNAQVHASWKKKTSIVPR